MDRKGTHSDESEKIAGRTERDLGWCNARADLGAIQGIDGNIQRRENAILPLWSLRFV